MAKVDNKPRRSTAATVRDRVERGGARLWKYADFQSLPQGAVAHALSRLAKEGVLKRVAKGVYYRPESTSFGPSMPSPTAVAAGTVSAPVYPAGLTAANALGLSSQNPYRAEYAVTTTAAPTALRTVVVHARRPAARETLVPEEGAILEVLRDRAISSDLSPEETVERLLGLLADKERFKRISTAALPEPPRVRAMLGALGQELGMPDRLLDPLRKSLNPLSRYDFGRLSSLQHASQWQAK